jgi:small basic protein
MNTYFLWLSLFYISIFLSKQIVFFINNKGFNKYLCNIFVFVTIFDTVFF